MKKRTKCAYCKREFERHQSNLKQNRINYCSRGCYGKDRTNRLKTGEIKDNLPKIEGGFKHPACKDGKWILYGKVPEICFFCKADRRTVRRIEIHHKDKNLRNNKPENLILLCSHCHRLVHLNKINI